MEKLASKKKLDSLVLAAAGMERMGFKISSEGHLAGEHVPNGLLARILGLEEILPHIKRARLELRCH